MASRLVEPRTNPLLYRQIFEQIPAGLRVSLVHFYDTVDLPDKNEARREADKTSKQEKYDDHNKSVAKVEESAGRASDGQLGAEEMDRVEGQVESCTAPGQERSPPPVVILGTKMEITEQHGGF